MNDLSLGGLTGGAKRLARRVACLVVGRWTYYSMWFRCRHGYWPRLGSPTTLNAKLLWIRLNANLTCLAPFVCKYEVRRFVAAAVGAEYLVPLHGVYDRVDAINFDALPERFVCKPTHGSKWIVIVRNKDSLDRAVLRRTCSRWLRTDFSVVTGDASYRKVRRRLLVEALLAEEDGDLRDYKWLCYAGEPRFIEMHEGRFTQHRSRVFDVDWRPLPMTWGERPIVRPVERPDTFEEMYGVAKRLCAPFPFVRVDLYSVMGKVYFGELTFVPAGARIPILPVCYDRMLGEGLPLVRDYLAYFRCRTALLSNSTRTWEAPGE